MLPIAPSGRTRIRLPACVCRHLIPATTAVVAVALAACFRFAVVRSLAPAVDDASAIALPELVGQWRAPGELRWDVQPRGAVARGYVVAASSPTGVAADPSAHFHYDARVGRAGAVLLLELHPSTASDSALAHAMRDYGSLLERTYVVFRLDLEGNRLRLTPFEPDSVRAALRDGRCATPYFADADESFVLTGTSAQVRDAWACAAARPGFLGEPMRFERVTIPTAVAGAPTGG